MFLQPANNPTSHFHELSDSWWNQWTWNCGEKLKSHSLSVVTTCVNLTENDTSCTPAFTVDGVTLQSFIAVNGQMPGPTLIQPSYWSECDKWLEDESTTMHWHGLRQNNTPWMDGMEHSVTQCTIFHLEVLSTTFLRHTPLVHFGTHSAFWDEPDSTPYLFLNALASFLQQAFRTKWSSLPSDITRWGTEWRSLLLVSSY